MPVSRAHLLAAWSTVMMLSTLALVVLDLSVRNAPAPPPKLGADDESFESLLARAGSGQPAPSSTQHLRSMLDEMARNAPKFLDRIDEGLARTKQSEAALATAETHIASVISERAPLPHFENGASGAAAEHNGAALQAWLRNLSDALPELLTTMEADTRRSEGTLPRTGARSQ